MGRFDRNSVITLLLLLSFQTSTAVARDKGYWNGSAVNYASKAELSNEMV